VEFGTDRGGTSLAGSRYVRVAVFRLVLACGMCAMSVILSGAKTAAQMPGPAPSPSPATPAPPPDALGRATPRGTVLGFLNAARKEEDDLAAQYLHTRLRGHDAATLAHQLYIVLDARLPARLTQVSDAPEGSRQNPLRPNEETVGAVPGRDGPVDIVLERVTGADKTPIWLFSTRTLAEVPTLYEAVTFGLAEGVLPRFVTGRRLVGVRLVEWLIVLLGFPVFYLATVLLDRMLRPVAARLWHRVSPGSTLFAKHVFPLPMRLLLVAAATQWVLTSLPLPLMLRQFGSSVVTLMSIAALVWLMFLLSGEVEAHVMRRFPRTRAAAAQSLVRVLRRAVDLLAVFVGVLAILRYFGVDPTPALAGLGVGGIAVALAAQKTLENIIAGASLIFDQAVRVGDFLKMGEISGTVDHIGLRSTRIRTLDRTIVSVPNSQIANASLETISARDKFWFHHVIGLRYETTPDQLRTVVDGVRTLLASHPLIDPESVRVRFLRLGAFSLDIDIFAYLRTRDWNHFLEVQESLLFGITDLVARAGAEIAFPSQTMYVDDRSAGGRDDAERLSGSDRPRPTATVPNR
jgi:MscS family membrane protein